MTLEDAECSYILEQYLYSIFSLAVNSEFHCTFHGLDIMMWVQKGARSLNERADFFEPPIKAPNSAVPLL